MTQQEILEYNKRCAEFLGWYYENNKWLKLESLKSGVIAVLKCNSDFDLKFHSDWNWIMEVVKAINMIPNSKNPSDTTLYTHRLNVQSILRSANKEAVVQAINQFLIWYETYQKSKHA